jgi:hypothetical protein
MGREEERFEGLKGLWDPRNRLLPSATSWHSPATAFGRSAYMGKAADPSIRDLYHGLHVFGARKA